jgi:hypothetical protein
LFVISNNLFNFASNLYFSYHDDAYDLQAVGNAYRLDSPIWRSSQNPHFPGFPGKLGMARHGDTLL